MMRPDPVNPYPAKKRFGQHFLIDRQIIDQIIAAIHPQRSDHVLEIGPGLGALTLPLLPLVAKIDAVELDRDLVPQLQQRAQGLGQLHLYQQDILQFTLDQVATAPKVLRVVGNLPYAITTPLLFHLFEQQFWIQDMHFMVQQEVAQRLVAQPGSKPYGRLTVMAGCHCQVSYLLAVPARAFRPRPQVDSAFIRLTPTPLDPELDQAKLDAVVKQAFSHRRKTLGNALKPLLTAAQLLAIDIDPTVRPEQLTATQFIKISHIL